MIRKHIIAHGRVQGVGLRFTVTGFAKKYNVTGWVRNLYDGRVEMEAQGLDHRWELFLKKSRDQTTVWNLFYRSYPLIGQVGIASSALTNWTLQIFLL